jgi:hypothetical protein
MRRYSNTKSSSPNSDTEVPYIDGGELLARLGRSGSGSLKSEASLDRKFEPENTSIPLPGNSLPALKTDERPGFHRQRTKDNRALESALRRGYAHGFPNCAWTSRVQSF